MKRMDGTHGWRFLSNDTNREVDQHLGKFPVHPVRLPLWPQAMRGRAEIAASVGAPYVHIIAPDKSSVYPEFWPDDLRALIAPVRPVDQILQACAANAANITYPVPELQAAGSADAPLYWRRDSHWTTGGAFVAAGVALEKAGLKKSPRATLEVAEKLFIGDLEYDRASEPAPARGSIAPERVRLCALDGDVDVISKDIMDHLGSTRIGNNGRLHAVLPLGQEALGNILMISDSFGHFVGSVLGACGYNVLRIHTTALPPQLVQELKPDAIITCGVERFALTPPTDHQVSIPWHEGQVTPEMITERALAWFNASGEFAAAWCRRRAQKAA